MTRCIQHMESFNLEKNIKIRSITGGALHRRSMVFHIEYNDKNLQYTINHVHRRSINLRSVTHPISNLNKILDVLGVGGKAAPPH